MVQRPEFRIKENGENSATTIHMFLAGQWSVILMRIAILLCAFAVYAGTAYASSASGSGDPIPEDKNTQDKVVYLSFDDGPGNHTREVLIFCVRRRFWLHFLCWVSRQNVIRS